MCTRICESGAIAFWDLDQAVQKVMARSDAAYCKLQAQFSHVRFNVQTTVPPQKTSLGGKMPPSASTPCAPQVAPLPHGGVLGLRLLLQAQVVLEWDMK